MAVRIASLLHRYQTISQPGSSVGTNTEFAAGNGLSNSQAPGLHPQAWRTQKRSTSILITDCQSLFTCAHLIWRLLLNTYPFIPPRAKSLTERLQHAPEELSRYAQPP